MTTNTNCNCTDYYYAYPVAGKKDGVPGSGWVDRSTKRKFTVHQPGCPQYNAGPDMSTVSKALARKAGNNGTLE